MHIISLSIAKGGVGKTTSSINISSILAVKEFNVLLVDIDPQGDSTTFYVDEHRGDNDISDVLLRDVNINDIITPSNFPNIDIAVNYCKVDQTKIKINDFINREQTLKNKLKELKKQYDFIIIDCPPALDSYTQNALVASSHILIPVKGDSSAYLAVSRIFEKAKEIAEIYNPDLAILGVFSIEKENLRVYNETMRSLKDDLGDLVLDTSIRRSKYVPESSYEQKPLITYARYSNPSFDYQKLVDEILTKLNPHSAN